MTKQLLNGVCLTIVAGALALPLVAQAPAKAEEKSAAAAPQQTTTAAAGQKVPEGGMPTFIRPETPEQRRARLGTAEDPGLEPDSKTMYWRFGRPYRIEKIPRVWAVFDSPDPNFVRPVGSLNVYKEIYQMNEKFLWIWIDEPTPEEAAAAAAPPEDLYMAVGGTRRFAEEDVQFFQKMRSEFTELMPPANDTVVKFEESSTGLPKRGSWRNGLAVADMNEDGFVDIIAPPERGSDATPAVFLGDGKGNWKFWRDAKWPTAMAYGSVAAADFNKDGHMDLAFGVHLQGVFVFLGDGKGNFTNVEGGLPRDFPTRRVEVVDVDRDGAMDIVAISEGPTAVRAETKVKEEYGRLRVFYNRKNGTEWEGANIADPARRLAGDHLVAANFNGDKYPDFAGSSIFFSSPDTIYLSRPNGKYDQADPKQGDVIPAASYYFASTAGPFTSTKRDDAIISFVRFWPTDLNPKLVPAPPAMTIAGMDRIAFDEKGEGKRYPIIRWASNIGVWGLGRGDFNGDGKQDLIFTRHAPREAVLLLNDGKGNFTRATVEGLTLEAKTNYDLKVTDVNGDKKPDVIVMYESSATTAFAERNGSIDVFLHRGTSKGPAAGKTAAK